MRRSHEDDPHKAVKTFRGKDIGLYSIESKDMERYVNSSLVIRGHKINLIPIRKNEKRNFRDPESIKIRIFDAYGLAFRPIDNEEFNEYFSNLGVGITKPTQPERCRDHRDVFNTNRFIVVKKTNAEGVTIDFGTRITVSGKSFKISYPGIERFCGLCDRKHGWDCPKKKRFEFLKQLRKGNTEICKIYSDSTLRHTNQLALTTNVDCMSGGGIGQICNLIPYDKKYEEVIINAGTNDVKIEPLEEFAYTIHKAEEKLRKLATDTPVTVVLPPISEETPELTIKGQHMREVLSKVDVIKLVNLENIEMETNAIYPHPTPEGTRQIIEQINNGREDNKNIILTGCSDDVVLPTIYRQVHSVFKSGCRGCDNLEYTPFLCETCKEAAKEMNTDDLQKRIKDLKDQLFPPIQNDVEMESTRNGRKRDLSSEDENQNDGKQKHAKANVQ